MSKTLRELSGELEALHTRLQQISPGDTAATHQISDTLQQMKEELRQREVEIMGAFPPEHEHRISV
jgi:hypothetical protein